MAKNSGASGPVTTVYNPYSYNLPVTGTSLRLWLDAYDPMDTGYQYTGDKDLGTWNDKSSFFSHATYKTGASTASTLKWQPNAFGGKPCFTFPGRLNGSGRYFGSQFLNGGGITTNTMHVFVVASQQSTLIGGGTDSEFCARFIGFGNGANTDDFNNTNTFGFLRQSDTGCGPYRANQYVANNKTI
jgi:hypothetical protein